MAAGEAHHETFNHFLMNLSLPWRALITISRMESTKCRKNKDGARSCDQSQDRLFLKLISELILESILGMLFRT